MERERERKERKTKRTKNKMNRLENMSSKHMRCENICGLGYVISKLAVCV